MIYLSVLIPSIPERMEALGVLLGKLESQTNNLDDDYQVEVISLIDNKKISIGSKRERLKNMASGKYFCFVDDDDDITEDYIRELLPVCVDEDVDVITFDTLASIDGKEGRIHASMNNQKNNQFIPGKITYRKPSHVNAWLTSKFKQYQFSDSMYGEDFDFCNQCYPHIHTGYRIDKVLHHYVFDKDITQAFEK